MHIATGGGEPVGGSPGKTDAPASLEPESSTAARPGPGLRPAARGWLTAAAWVAGSVALTALYVRVSLNARVNSDGGNNALQGWDMLHGNLLLSGWQIGDANYYFLELPLNALSEAIFGLDNFATHVASALTYLLVTVVALAAAMTGSRGPARAARCGVVLAVLAAPIFGGATYLVLEEPDHIGTGVFIIGSFLLIDRLTGRWFTAPLLLVILCAGQFSDLTVRYVAVPAIVIVCGYRALAARSYRGPDALLAYTAIASVPLSTLYVRLWVRLGGFTAAPPHAGLSPASHWLHNTVYTWDSIRVLFGAAPWVGVVPGSKSAFGLACIVAGAFGLVCVAWRWRRASRAEQLIAFAIVSNVAVFTVSGFARDGNAHEITALLPCGAVLAARALVPERIRGALPAIASAAVAALVVALPLAYAATRPNFPSAKAPLAAWLAAHGLTYGLSCPDDSSATALLTSNRVELRAVHIGAFTLGRSHFETKESWYFPSLHDATFAVANPGQNLPASVFLRYFGQPAATYQVDGWTVMVYRENLLTVLSVN
jgi:hypothetical protein